MEAKPLFEPASRKQEMFINSQAFRTIYGGSAGGGKAQPLYSKVLTKCGWKTMGDIEVGDIVITPKNELSPVLETFYHKNKDIYEITTQSGVVVRACNEHLWKVDVTKPKVKSKFEVCDTDTIISYMNDGRSVFLPQCDAIGEVNDIELPIDPYVLGVLIAEGGLTSGHPIFTNKDEQLVSRVSDWCDKEGYSLSPTKDGLTFRIISKNPHNDIRNSKGQFVKSNEITEKLKTLGLAFTSSYTKFIPDMYLTKASIAQRFELLKGLMDSDGSISESLTCEYSTSSDALRDDVIYLVRSLGGIARVTSRHPTYSYKGQKLKGALNHRIWVRFADPSNIFFIKRKLEKCRVRKSPVRDKIVDIRFVGKEDAKCIYIEDKEHLYITDDFAVTHNTYMGLMRFLLYVDDPHFVGFVIRKNATDLKGAGSSFDEAIAMFTKYDPKIKITKQPMQMTFSSGAKLYFTGLDGDAGMKALQGKQISAIMLDESTHFTEEEIVWAESRLRTMADMIPNIWLTCNPDSSSVIFEWIKDFYLYPKGAVVNGELVEGRAIPEKDGVVRYYLKVGNKTEWGESREELIERFGNRFPKDKKTGESTASPKSFTFISATCLDNPPLLEANPDYVSTLAALPRITRERLLHGNWLAREEGSGYFKREWTPTLSAKEIFSNDEVVRRVRAWDLASTLPSEAYPDPDYTVGVLIARTRGGYYVIEDVVRGRWRVGELDNMLVEQTRKDIEMYGYNCSGYLPIEPASAGKMMRHHLSKLFGAERVPIKFFKVGSGKSKLERFLPFASVAENDLVRIVEGDWNEEFLTELELFSGTRSKIHDDIVDACADAYNLVATTKELPIIPRGLLRMK